MTLSGVTLPSSGTIGFNNDDQPTSAFTISNNATLNGTLTVQVGGAFGPVPAGNATVGTVTLSGYLTGSGGLTKSGPGALIVGTNGLSGSLSVTGGSLYLSGASQATGISVATGTTLGGIAQAQALSAGANIANGGTIDLSKMLNGSFGLNSLSFAGSATININDANGQYAAMPAISAGSVSTSSSPISLSIANIPTTGTPPVGSGTVEILQYTGTIGGAGFGAFNLVSPTSIGHSSYGLTISNNILELTYSADYPFWTGRRAPPGTSTPRPTGH